MAGADLPDPLHHRHRDAAAPVLRTRQLRRQRHGAVRWDVPLLQRRTRVERAMADAARKGGAWREHLAVSQPAWQRPVAAGSTRGDERQEWSLRRDRRVRLPAALAGRVIWS